MSLNKKFSLIFLVLVLVPIFFSYLNFKYANLRNFSWGYNHINQISIFSLLVAIGGNLLIFFQNKKSMQYSRFWKIFSILVIIILLILLYIGSSLSNFGF